MIRLAEHLSTAATEHSSTALTRTAREMIGSMILGIAAEVRALAASGVDVCNLTVGDFDPRQFPIPQALRDATVAGFDGFQTNYPPSEGLPELRAAICAWYRRELGIDISPDWVVVASGARPVMYATYRLFIEPGDTMVFAAPSWNNGYYAQLTDANAVALATRAEDGFFPTVEQLAPWLSTARLFTLNSPLNPTGTVIARERLAALARAIVDENTRRATTGERPLMWMFDQVYWTLTFGGAQHAHPATLVPEVTPYVVTIDAVSKAFAATGLRVGWAVLQPRLAERMKALIGHVGAWAPRPEQAGTATLLNDEAALASYGATFRAALAERLDILDKGLTDLGVLHLVPQGAMYLSVCFDQLFGRPGLDGAPMRTNEDIRRFLLQRAGVAVVPFQAFDLPTDDGWFRMSVGAVSPGQLRAALSRLGAALA
jgi:aspartate aminotransferase